MNSKNIIATKKTGLTRVIKAEIVAVIKIKNGINLGNLFFRATKRLEKHDHIKLVYAFGEALDHLLYMEEIVMREQRYFLSTPEIE